MRALRGSGRETCLYIVRCMLGGMHEWHVNFFMLDQSLLLGSF